MITLRSLRNYTLRTLEDASRALAFLERATQDSLTKLDTLKAESLTFRNSDRTDVESVQFGEHVFAVAVSIRLQDSKGFVGKTSGVSNVSTSSITVESPGTIRGAATLTLASHATVTLLSDGRGGWW